MDNATTDKLQQSLQQLQEKFEQTEAQRTQQVQYIEDLLSKYNFNEDMTAIIPQLSSPAPSPARTTTNTSLLSPGVSSMPASPLVATTPQDIVASSSAIQSPLFSPITHASDPQTPSHGVDFDTRMEHAINLFSNKIKARKSTIDNAIIELQKRKKKVEAKKELKLQLQLELQNLQSEYEEFITDQADTSPTAPSLLSSQQDGVDQLVQDIVQRRKARQQNKWARWFPWQWAPIIFMLVLFLGGIFFGVGVLEWLREPVSRKVKMLTAQ